MSVSPLAAFFKRFAVKFIEVVGAGIATAVSGYLLAHFSGYWSPRTGAPPIVQVSPNVSVVSKGERRQQQDATAVTSDLPSSRQSARPSAKSNLTAATHKPAGNDIGDDGGKVRDAETIEAQVRAALANVDAGRSAPSNAATQNPDGQPAGAAAIALPATAPLQKPADASAGQSSVAAAPPAADAAPQPQQQAPSEPIPLTPVEIKSLPVAAVEPASQPPSEPSSVKKESQANPQADGSAGPQDDRSLFGAIKKIPEFFRAAMPASDADAPRPPRPVGE
jgi:hypothetical protein